MYRTRRSDIPQGAQKPGAQWTDPAIGLSAVLLARMRELFPWQLTPELSRVAQWQAAV